MKVIASRRRRQLFSWPLFLIDTRSESRRLQPLARRVRSVLAASALHHGSLDIFNLKSAVITATTSLSQADDSLGRVIVFITLTLNSASRPR
jgi:hypothetical protein